MEYKWICKAYQLGLSLEQIGQIFSRTPKGISVILKREGIPRRRAGKAGLNKAEGVIPVRVREIIALRKEGMSFPEIGSKLGCSKQNVQQMVKFWTTDKEMVNEENYI